MKEIKGKLQKIAKNISIKYNPYWFKYMWLSKRENILLEYLWMCPDPVYERYGKNSFVRAKNIENFLSSREFEVELLHRFGGQVINKESFKRYFPNWIEEIENSMIKRDYLNIYNKIDKRLGKSEHIAILTKSDKESEKAKLKSFVLFHEWIHILINKNNLTFSSSVRDNWKFNEGLVTYLQESSVGKLDKLEEGVKYWNDYNFQKQYYIYAIIFRELLKKINNPKKRREAIINLRKSLLR
jgi:hypothetical protein